MGHFWATHNGFKDARIDQVIIGSRDSYLCGYKEELGKLCAPRADWVEHNISK